MQGLERVPQDHKSRRPEAEAFLILGLAVLRKAYEDPSAEISFNK